MIFLTGQTQTQRLEAVNEFETPQVVLLKFFYTKNTKGAGTQVEEGVSPEG